MCVTYSKTDHVRFKIPLGIFQTLNPCVCNVVGARRASSVCCFGRSFAHSDMRKEHHDSTWYFSDTQSMYVVGARRAPSVCCFDRSFAHSDMRKQSLRFHCVFFRCLIHMHATL